MTVFANTVVNSSRTRIVPFGGTAIKIPSGVKSISILSKLAGALSVNFQDSAAGTLLDVPVFGDSVLLAHYSNTGGTVAAVDSLALSVKPVAFVQAAAATSTTGGALAAATYYYKIVAVTAAGENLISNEVSQVTTGATSSNTLTWGTVAGAVEYRVYRGTASNTQTGYYSVTTGALTFLDVGAALTTGAVPAGQTFAIGVYIEVLAQTVFGGTALAPTVTDTDVYLNITGEDAAALVIFEV